MAEMVNTETAQALISLAGMLDQSGEVNSYLDAADFDIDTIKFRRANTDEIVSVQLWQDEDTGWHLYFPDEDES
jgi:hypothetical protein